MAIHPEVFDTARHEACHAAYGQACGMPIYEVYVAPSGSHGHADVGVPFDPYQLEPHWRENPTATTQRMRQVIGMICAPVACENRLFPGPCGDSDRLGAYARWWGWLKPVAGVTPLPWLTLLAQARADVRRWATAPGAAFALDELACWLARAGTVDSEQWRWLWAQSFAAPLHQAVAPAVVPTPKLSPVTTRSPVRPVTRPLSVHDLLEPYYDWRTGFTPGHCGLIA